MPKDGISGCVVISAILHDKAFKSVDGSSKGVRRKAL